MIIAVPKETADGEQRVALTPGAAATLIKQKHEVRVERGAGDRAGFTDAEYTKAGATIVEARGALINGAEVIAQVRTAGANPNSNADLASMKPGQVVIGFC